MPSVAAGCCSWVQEQLQDHTTELWSDGVEDYLQHASRLLKDFDDVLDAPAGEQQAAVNKPAAAGALAQQGPAKKKRKRDALRM
mgnify:FL=1